MLRFLRPVVSQWCLRSLAHFSLSRIPSLCFAWKNKNSSPLLFICLFLDEVFGNVSYNRSSATITPRPDPNPRGSYTFRALFLKRFTANSFRSIDIASSINNKASENLWIREIRSMSEGIR